MRSLRMRILAAALALVAVVVAATLLLSRQVVVAEFDAFVQRGQTQAAAEVLVEMQAFATRTGSLDGADPVLARIHERTRAILILLRDGNAIAAAPAMPATINLRRNEIEFSISDGTTHSEFVIAGPLPVIVDATGQTLASLVVLSPPSGGRGDFKIDVNRGFWWIALDIGLLGLLIGGWAAGRLVKPVEELTDAARKLSAGELTQRVLVSRTDEIGELAGAFNTMAESLERNEELRRSLLSDVAHELRTPLTHVRAELEALQDGLRQPTPEVINRLHADARHLERIVDDLRDLAQAEAGQLRLTLESIDPVAALRNAAASVESAAAAKGVRIDVASGSPIAVRADQARFRQVIINLLDNAIRYAPAGSAVVVSAAAGEDGRVAITVSDEGVGVAAEHLPRLFDRFFRADESRDRRTGGAGLGLAIVKQLVTVQGGTVTATNLAPRGFRVTVTLPGPHK